MSSSSSAPNEVMNGKVCIVTGANSGVGRATATRLAKSGATVVMVCRDRGRGEAAVREVRLQTGVSSAVELMLADLSSMDSVRQLADTFKQSFNKLHVLDNNAGVILSECTPTIDGFESTFAINHLSHFLLTNLLMDVLKTSAPSRVISVTSDAHFGGHIDFESLRCGRPYRATRAYSQSKLAQVLFTYELAKRTAGTGVTSNCVHPGAVRTNWGDSGGTVFRFIMKIARPFLLSPERGANGPVYLASSPSVHDLTGRYYSGTQEAKSSEESHDEGTAKRLWEVSSQMARLPA
jgi:NAD(P)-dependent dehydrogenase (short-subunit alcohol dehydrogenase family)